MTVISTSHDTSDIRPADSYDKSSSEPQQHVVCAIKGRQQLNLFASPRTREKEILSMKPEKYHRRMMCHTSSSSLLNSQSAELASWRPNKRQFGNRNAGPSNVDVPPSSGRRLGKTAFAVTSLTPTMSPNASMSGTCKKRIFTRSEPKKNVSTMNEKGGNQNVVPRISTVNDAAYGFQPPSRVTTDEPAIDYAQLAQQYPNHHKKYVDSEVKGKRHVRGVGCEGQGVRDVMTPALARRSSPPPRYRARTADYGTVTRVSTRPEAPFPTNTPRAEKEKSFVLRSLAPWERVCENRREQRTDTAWRERFGEKARKDPLDAPVHSAVCANKRYVLSVARATASKGKLWRY